MSSTPVDVEVLIIGAGLSGIGAAAHLTRQHPGRSYQILESRAASGGTWDLFRYPGIRSDSDMFTLGYRFKPWRDEKALAPGSAILDYVRETAREYGVDEHIVYGHRVVSAAWDSESATWTVTAQTSGGDVVITARIVWSCAGYYDYDAAYAPELPGIENFGGQVVHPQFWPEDLEYAGKSVLVIGSGATAVTLIPALVQGGAGPVTMLQRSPTYVMSMPSRDPVACFFQRWLPDKAAYAATRWKSILVATGSYALSRRRPDVLRKMIRKQAADQLPAGYAVDTHFNPRYDPWDQRLCLVPDGDLFKVLRDGSAQVVTDTIEGFTPTGVRLTSGSELAAEVVVAATGLQLKPFGGVDLSVDGEPIKVPDTMAYKALMLSGVPNLIFTIGYTNASWTLKADLVADYFCRLLTHLDRGEYRSFVAPHDPTMTPEPLLDFTSGYVQRSVSLLPKQGDREPWKLRQNYLRDVRTIRRGTLEDGVLRFSE